MMKKLAALALSALLALSSPAGAFNTGNIPTYSDSTGGNVQDSGIQLPAAGALAFNPYVNVNEQADVSTFNLGGWQLTPIKGGLVTSQTYTDLYTAFPNVYQVSSFTRMNGSSNVVSVFGQCEAIKARDPSLFGACWGANFVALASVNGAAAQVMELDSENQFGAGATAYGEIIAAFGPSVGAAQGFPSQDALLIQTGNSTGVFVNGILFNDIVHSAISASGSLIKANAGTVAGFGINFSGTYGTAEISTPSFAVGATPVSENSNIHILASSSGNPSISAFGAGGSPATNANLVISSLGTGQVAFATEGNGPVQFAVDDRASAVNHLEVQGAVTGIGPTLQAVGSDTNINIAILPKGTGIVSITSGLTVNGTAGVTCSGTPTVNFATIGGVVTHC